MVKVSFVCPVFNKEKYLTNDILKNLIRFLLEIEFFVIRIIVILNDITVKIKIPEDKRFLSIGIQEIYENDRKKIKKIKEIKFSSIPKFNINYNLTDIKTKINIECQNKLKSCLADERLQDEILNERINAQKKYNIESTPTIYINEKKYKGKFDLTSIKKYIEKI